MPRTPALFSFHSLKGAHQDVGGQDRDTGSALNLHSLGRHAGFGPSTRHRQWGRKNHERLDMTEAGTERNSPVAAHQATGASGRCHAAYETCWGRMLRLASCMESHPRQEGTTFSLMNCQIIRVISSPSISTTGLATLILLSASRTGHR